MRGVTIHQEKILVLIQKFFKDHAYLDTHIKMTLCIPSWSRGRKVKFSLIFSRLMLHFE